MKKLKNIFASNIFYYVVIFFSFVYFLFYINVEHISKYDNFDNLKLKIVSINYIDNGYKFILKGKEKLIAYYYTDKKENYNLGDIILISGKKKDIHNNTVDNTFNYKKYLYNQGIYNVIEITNINKIKSNRNIFYSMKTCLINRGRKLSKSYPYVNSLILGNNSFLGDDVLGSYRNNGISHLFAISGLHISVFMMIINKILSKFGIGEKKRCIIIVFFLLYYMFLTNFSMSVMRGGIFTILILINKLLKLDIKTINLLLFTLAIIIFINPLFLYNLGLQFSYIITLFLILYKDIINRFKNGILKLLLTSFLSFVVAYPITVNNFFQVNFLSILYNIFFVPYVSYILLPFTLISYLFPFFDNLLYLLIKIIEQASLILERFDTFKIIMCKLDLSILVSYYVVLCILLSFAKKRKVKYLFFIFFFYFMHFINPFKNSNYVYMFDVNQGDSILINVNDNVTLIDTGGVVMYSDNNYTYQLSNNRILPYLKSKGIRRIDNLLISHGDFDHMGEAVNIVNNFKVGKVIFNCGSYNDLEKNLIDVLNKKNIKYYSCVDEIEIDSYKLKFLNTKDYDNENDNSNVVYFNYNNIKFLFMGDAGINREKDILKKYSLEKIDFLKVGHHGSNTSSGEEFINNINPKYSLISVGKNNRYGHPKDSVLNTLNDSKIYRTDKDGSVEIKLKDYYNIRTCSP